MKSGFPPKYIQDFLPETKLADIKEISFNDSLIVEIAPKEQDHFVGKQRISPSNYSKIPQKPNINSNNLSNSSNFYNLNIIRRKMPSDNSCFFHAISYCLQGTSARKHSEYPLELRKVIADNVANDPNTFTQDFLGQHPLEYQKFILNPDSWGGAIEMKILSHFYKIQICAFDCQLGKVFRFGEDEKYDTMIFLIYNGVHYDALVFASPDSQMDERYDITIYSTRNQEFFRKAEHYMKQQYYNGGDVSNQLSQMNSVNLTQLKCTICNAIVNGTNGAESHASKTGHVDFQAA